MFVHGSWGDHNNWSSVVAELSKNFRLLSYDRRGHSKSERSQRPVIVEDDISDLIGLIEHFNFAPAHIVGNSGGAAIVLKTAARRPDLFRTLVVHEPPLFDLLKEIHEAGPMLKIIDEKIDAVVDLIQTGQYEQAARLFVETIAFGPGAWTSLSDQLKKTFIYNAPTFLDEIHDPENLKFDTTELIGFNKRVLLTHGTQSPPFFVISLNIIANAVPHAKRFVFEGAGHVPHMSHPEQYIQTLRQFFSGMADT